MSTRWTRLALSCALLLAGCARSPPVLACPRDDHDAQCARSLAEGDLQKADFHCAMALEFSPWRVDARANWGLVALLQGDIAKAKQRLLLALQYNPDHVQAHANLGMTYLEEGAYAQARESFKKALRVNPDHLHARYHLGLTLLKMDKAAEARKEFDAVLAANPDVASAHQVLGVLDHTERNLEGAFQHLSRATQLTPDAYDAWRDLGTVLLDLRRFSNAEAAFGNCVRLQTTDTGCRDGLEKARSAAAP
jgi:tetratricopeptide (TPR) repeat protein